MRSAFVILFAVGAVVNAQFTESNGYTAAYEENLESLADPGLGEASYSAYNSRGEGGPSSASPQYTKQPSYKEARFYDDDSEVITGVTDSGDFPRQQYAQAPLDQYESQSAPRPTNQRCLEKNERYPVPGSCDRYVECLNGTAEEKLCPDGLRYNPNVRFNVYPCQYPSDVPCLERSALQPAQPTDDCPHQFGYFKIGDAKNCSSFRNCVNGVGYDFTCPEGLAFSSDTYRCEWPDQVTDCDSEAFLGFKCPEVPVTKELGPPVGYRFYRSSDDCQKYFLCIEGRPRKLSCGGFSGFDESTSACVSAEDIESCPSDLKSAAARSRIAEEQRQAAEEKLSKKWLRGEPIISTVAPPSYRQRQNTASPARYEQYYSTVTPEQYGEYGTTSDPADVYQRF